MPWGRKIMNSIMIRPEHDLLVVVEHGQYLRQGTQQAAPTTPPKMEPMPPSTAMVTSSIECRKPAGSG